MIIDILVFLVISVAIFKGYSKGFIIAVFSFTAIFIGLAAAMKCSAIVATWLQQSIETRVKWLPFISFVLVMIGTIILTKIGATILQRGASFIMLGWLNRVSGALLYAVIYITVLSAVLFFAEKLDLLKASSILSSKTYPYVKPWGPKMMDVFGVVLPFLKGLFSQLELFFQGFKA